jgi:predicted RNA binding protein with dsRBD fold (UPF0201 family)
MKMLINYKQHTLKQALLILDLQGDKAIHEAIESLLREGYTEKGILFTLCKSDAQEKILKFKHDSRLKSIFINEVRKYSYKIGDERWKK